MNTARFDNRIRALLETARHPRGHRARFALGVRLERQHRRAHPVTADVNAIALRAQAEG